MGRGKAWFRSCRERRVGESLAELILGLRSGGVNCYRLRGSSLAVVAVTPGTLGYGTANLLDNGS